MFHFVCVDGIRPFYSIELQDLSQNVISVSNYEGLIGRSHLSERKHAAEVQNRDDFPHLVILVVDDRPISLGV